jgi:hypothetical protein
MRSTPAPYLTPPDTCVLMLKCPAEIRRQIFAESLPSRDLVHYPKCDDDIKAARFKRQTSEGLLVVDRQTRGPTTNLMVLNKTICGEIAEVIYQERWFAIHVHEGLTTGGVEFLSAGRQPLHFQDGVFDHRFAKFARDEDFGFDRIKKVRVVIYQSDEDECLDKARHTAINTYLMNLSLCRLLHRSGDKEKRITSLVIEFARTKKSWKTDATAGRRAAQRKDHYWWDPEGSKPRATSIHNISNIELVLRPFAQLTGCHSVRVELPPKLASHKPTIEFVAKLKSSMTSKLGTMWTEDDLQMNIDRARGAMEHYVRCVVAGKEREEMQFLALEEFMDAGVLDVEDDHDGYGQLGETTSGKHPRSASDSGGFSNPEPKRRRSPEEVERFGFRPRFGRFNGASDGDEEMLAVALSKSQNELMQEEEREMQRAIAASLGQPVTPERYAFTGEGYITRGGEEDEVENGSPPIKPKRRQRRAPHPSNTITNDADGDNTDEPGFRLLSRDQFSNLASPQNQPRSIGRTLDGSAAGSWGTVSSNATSFSTRSQVQAAPSTMKPPPRSGPSSTSASPLSNTWHFPPADQATIDKETEFVEFTDH